ncbi:MAG: tRNA preQ1(34) S-adenosylmethionine ribosyltransferase-isomerase QueA [Deltaproteobacteria bacterium]|nr:tRNA preQ1(34) S-adenosylmethionine ribosyltransferase-isomerase QueA [Deltaproteobacteria bacterium]
MNIEQFDYNLPKELIAQYPLDRGKERLLVLDRAEGSLYHKQFEDILEYLSEDDLLVLNDTKVIYARLLGVKATGGRVEVLLIKSISPQRWYCFVKASKPPRPGMELFFDKGLSALIIDRIDDRYEVAFSDPAVVHSVGKIPLPPYIEREVEELDETCYQTVYAHAEGSVAAPTAGLHFTEEILQRIQSKGTQLVYITLHVGPGTFVPVRTQRIEDHTMHSEEFTVSDNAAGAIRLAMATGKRIVAVGTTTSRVLEHLMVRHGEIVPGTGSTNIFIYQGFAFRCVGALLTNFHLPCSTLLMLVAAFGGYDLIINAYKEAVEKEYRFFSYGDAMFIF